MIKRNAGKLLVGNAMAICVIAAAILLAGHFHAQAQGKSGKTPAPEDTLKIGTYDVQKAFQEHPAQAKLREATQKAQSDMKKAQQQGNRQKMQQIQKQYTKTRDQFRQEFEQDVSEVMPELAKKTGVEAVAQEVVYTAKDVRTKDITDQLINSFGKDKEKPPQKELPAFPE